MQRSLDQPIRTESQTRIVERTNSCLRSGDYSRALDLLRELAEELRDDPELAELEKRAHDGLARNSDANSLITASQELFAQQKPAEAIQLLRKAYELDTRNSLARSILANALVEHAHSLVESDWLQAETLTNQALALNPAHPTAKTIDGLIVDRKQNSSVDDWVAQAQKLQASGDLFAALGWVAEGLAVHPDDPKLTQIHDAIQRDQGARRRQARRGDLAELRRMQHELDGASDVAAKQALAARIQTVAAKHWTDGEILSIANALLLRLGLVHQESSSASPRGKSATVILHVPRPSAGEPAREAGRTILTSGKAANPAFAASGDAPRKQNSPHDVTPAVAPPVTLATLPKQLDHAPVASAPDVLPAADEPASPKQALEHPAKPRSLTLLFVAAAAIVMIAATFFLTRKHYAAPVANNPAVAPAAQAPVVSAPAVPDYPETTAVTPPDPTRTASAPTTSKPAAALEPPPVSGASSDAVDGKAAPAIQPLAPVSAARESAHGGGTLTVIAGQDGASVFLDGKLQPQLTHGGQLSVANLEAKDYLVQVSKNGFQDPAPQKVSVRKGEPAKLVFNLQPQPQLASMTIQGGAPETAVFIDQALAGTVKADGSLALSNVNPGDHMVELRREGYKPRQIKKHFVAGGTVDLTAADAALDAASGELKITFSPVDASVAIAKGDLLKMVSSGVPLTLAPGTYTLTARTAEKFTRSATLDVVAGHAKTLDLSLAPSGMSRWEDPGAWKQEKGSFLRKGGDFVLYGDLPASGTFVFSALVTKGRLLQWVLNYSDPKNYVLLQMDENNFYRTVIHNGEKRDQIIVPEKGDKKSFRMMQVRVSATEIVHQVKQGDRWIALDHWSQPGADLSAGKFGFYIPGGDEVELSNFAHYIDLNVR